ncbi:endonuclease/exonuclease/phosphatase family protein [Spirosoma utsteinense]|uniref:Endonuclease/exonuclease/phosphatase family metal-dependent hydrolase n=1 Tax=Spirosoma utsteinense TaxID=2585773 RepID=A0ABR6W6N3_9BACT|nr:endonuclease/exonuclease/phosphatase family protein [Spirosoma utsteinense]MBC3787560.1 endonuclease/exonuclease/phosphatase family metal-dependent hydrolase [Spirosoma utsteinense]MBC3792247.1 endonuclease/exonuclease/phosphatase family metal-dependent hydrolase [Spirosoma utsteinense]
MANFLNYKPYVLAGLSITWKTIRTTGRLFYDKYRQFPLPYTTLSVLFFTMAFCYYPVDGHWLTGFVMMSLPLVIPCGLIASVYLFFKQQKMIATAGLIWVLFSFVVVKRLVGISGSSRSPVGMNQTATLKVLSFNSETFPVSTDAKFDASLLEADIACFQEYSPNAQIQNQYEARIEKLTCFDKDRQVGLALFSKYPIVNQYGHIWNRAEGPNINGFVCADIAYGPDTIRVVNVHLWSMGVRSDQAVDALQAGNVGLFFYELFDTFDRLKEGFEKRNDQLKEVESYVVGSRYPVIICGDFNETPLGYSYGKLTQNFRNAFEEAGVGMGFTLNRYPYCVRIDQQFVSSDWHIEACQTLSGISFSDHFPVLAQYVLKTSSATPTERLALRK